MKRVLIVGLVIVLALGGMGMMTAAASEVVPGSSSRQQDEDRVAGRGHFRQPERRDHYLR